jgi:thiol-disulfide isomerase/thioredoxin
MLDGVRGYPVVINAWAHWCAPCVQEFPHFQQAALEYGDRVAFLGVNETDTTADARRFAEQFPVPYPHVEDPDGKILDTVVKSVPGLPMTIFLDRSGRLQYVRPGKLASEETLFELIDRYALGKQ